MTRAHLLLSSALVLAVVPGWMANTWAQTAPGPNELPAGMRVIAGQVSASAGGNTLLVNQGSNRAALDWSSFNIGSRATVRFQDPSAQALTLNRVSGPGASVIAGRLTSNGQMVLINQSGVVFMPGAVVDAQSVVVSAAGITEAGMRSGVATGHFALDQPAHLGASVQNSGRISVARAGLAALVAPQVANHGRINAAFGSVSLLGVTSHVVDLYGDGLLSIDVSRQTLAGAGGQAALVTNDGVIAAHGGTVTLSTDAIDGMVTNLVTAGGTIDTDSDGRQGGRVLIDAQGGVATVTGTIGARGIGRFASLGGEVAVQASERVNIASSAVIDASGRTGGGTVAIGTTLARARHGVGFAAPTAKLVGIAAGARVAADALVAGTGGQITVLSSDNTVTEGLLSAQGGAISGDGGRIEVSGTLGLSLLGVVDVTAARGRAGSLTIDPTDLIVQNGGTSTLSGGVLDVEPPPANNTATIDPTVLQAASGNVTLISHDNIDVLSEFSLNSNGLLTLTATTGTINVGGGIINSSGGIVMTAGSDIFINAAVTASSSISILAGGALTQAVGAPITSTGSFVALSAAGGVITLNDLVSANASVNLLQATGVVQNAGSILSPALFSSNGIGGAVSLQGGANNVASLGGFAATGGFAITDIAPTVTVSSPITVSGGPLTILAPGGAVAVQAALSTAGTGVIALAANTDITVSAPITAADALSLVAAEGANGGSIVQLTGGGLTSTNDAIALSAGGSIALGDNVTASNASLGSLNVEHGATFALNGGVVQSAGSIVTPAIFSSSGVGGSVSLPSAGNSFVRAGPLRAGGSLTLVDSATLLTVSGPLQAGTSQTLSITAPQLAFALQGGTLTAPSGTVELSPASGSVTLGAGGGFSLTQADLADISTGLLRIGKTAAGGSASSVTVAGSFDITTNSTASNLELDAGSGGITLVAGPLIVGNGGTLLLGTPGTVSQVPGALINAGTVAGIGTLGALELSNTGNTIGTLGPVNTGASEINVATGGTLALAGPIATTGGATLTADGSISLSGALSAGVLSLNTTLGDVVWSTPFSATTVTGAVGGTASLIDTNTATTTLGAFSTFGALTLTTSGALTTSGTVSTGDVTLAASGLLTVASAVSGFTIDLSAATLAEDTTLGSLRAISGEGIFGLLTSHGGIGGSATLLGANTLTDIGSVVATGTLSLLNTRSLRIDSGVGASSASFRVTQGGSIEIDQPLSIPQAGTLSLRADDLVATAGATSDVVSNVDGGTITLIGVAPDSAETVVLGGGAVSSVGTLAVSNANFLLGALRATTLQLGGLPDGSLTAAGLVVQSASLASGVTLLLDTDATGSVTQTASFTVDTLGGNVGSGGVLLSNAGNSIAAVGGLAVAGGATLVDAAASLTVNGAFSASSAGGLAIAVDAFGFGSGGSLSAGTVAVGPRGAGRTLGIGDTANAFNIELGDLSKIVAGTLDAGSSGIAGSTTAQSVVLAGTANLASGALVLDAGAGGVAQSGGTLDVGTLAGTSAAGFFVNDGGNNTIATLGAIRAIAIGINSVTGLQVTGAVSATAGVLGLTAPGVTVQSGGSLVASGGTIGFDIDALAGFGAGAVVDTGSVVIAPFSNAVLTVGPAAGHVDLSVVTAGTIVLTANSHGIAFSGAVAPGAGTLVLQAANAPVTETASDSLSVGTLLGLAGSVSMPGGNSIGTLAGFTVGLGDFLLDNAANLAVTSSVIANNPSAPQTITLQAPTLTLGAGVVFNVADSSSSSGLVLQSDTLLGAPVSADVPGGKVTLERLTAGAQSFSQSGGIAAGTLQLGGFDLSSTSLTLGNLSGLTITTLQLESAGSVTQTGSLVAPGGTLAGQAGSLLLNASGNVFAAVGSLALSGNVTLVDAAPSLAIAGAFSASASGIMAIAVDQFSIGAAGSLSAGTVAIGPLGAGKTVGIGDTAGLYNIELGDLSKVAAGTLDAGSSGIAGTATAQQVVLAGTANLAAGTLGLDADAAGVSQVGGTLNVATLAGSTSGSFAVALAGNTIGQLGAISASSIDVVDQSAVRVIAAVSASSGALTLASPSVTIGIGGGLAASGGVLTLDTDALASLGAGLVVDSGTVAVAPFSNTVLTVGPAAGQVDVSTVAAATLDLAGNSHGIAFSGRVAPGASTLVLQAAGASVTETAADSLVVTVLQGAAGSLSLPGTGNAIGTLAGFTVDTGNLSIVDAGLAVSGAVAATDANAAQSITLSGSSLTLQAGAAFSTSFASTSAALVLQTDTLSGAVNATIPGGTVLLERLTTGAQSFAQSGGITTGTLQLGGSDLSSTSLVLGNLLGLSVVTVRLESAGAVSQTGSLVAPGSTLTGQAGSVLLASTGNTLGALDGFSTTGGGGFSLTDAAGLNVLGTVTTGTGTLSLTDLAAVGVGISLQPGSVLTAAALVLGAPIGASVAQDSTGVIGITTLSGSVAGDVLLDGAANAVAAIGSLSVGGQLRLTDTSTLTEATTGILNAGTLAGTYGGDLRLNGTANAIGALGPLTASGTLTLTAADPTLAGLVTAAQMSFLVNGFGYSGGSLVATGIGPLQPGPHPLFATGGTVEIAPRDAGVLNLGAASGSAPFVAAGVLANVDASLLRLGLSEGRETATGIAVNAPVAVSSALPASGQVATVDLEATGPGQVTEAAGATFGIPGMLIGDTGALSLTGGANAVPVLGGYTTNGGGFALDDGGALAVEGNVVASGIALAAAGALTLDAGSLIAPGGTVDLTAASGSEVSGIINAAVLDSSGTPGTFSLGGANQVAGLGVWNASGALTLVDDTSADGPAVLTVSGPVSVTALVLRAASIALTGNVNAGSVASLATTAGGVTQTGGTLSAGLLTSPGVPGDVLLGSAGNAVTSLGAFSVPGHSFLLTDSVPLGVVDALTANAATLTDPTSITVNAAVTAPLITVRGGALAIDQGGTLVAPAGTVDLVASGATESGSGVILAATLLSGGTPSGAFALGGANSIDVLGSFQMASGGSLLLVDSTALTIAGRVSADSVDLSTSSGGVMETSGSVSTGLLSSSFGINGDVTLANSGNAIAALANIELSGGPSTSNLVSFVLEQPGSLQVQGTVSAIANITLQIGGNLAIGTSGRLESTVVDLSADGATEAASGAIAAAVFESSQGASGAFFLTGANSLTALGVFEDNAGALIVNDTQALRVDGPVQVSFLGLTAPGIALDGNINAAGMQVATSAGGFTQTGGVLSAGLLTAPSGIAGAVSLPDANQIIALGDFAAQSPVTLNDSTDLAINGSASAPAGLTLTVTGNLTEGPQGSVATSILSGSAASVTLAQAANAIGTLDFTTAGSLVLADGQSLTVGTLSALGASLSVTGDLTLAGNVSAADALLTLNATGAVTQTGGVVTALQLDGIANSFSLTASNSIAELADITAPGGFTLVNASGLALFGPVQGGVIDLSIASGGILQLPDGILSGQLRSTGGIVGDSLLTAANQLTAIGPLTDRGNFVLSNTEALAVGNVTAATLDLSTSAGGISQTGPITAATLQSSAGIVGAADFSNAGNQLGTLGAVIVTGGDLTLADASSLVVAGRVIAPGLTLAVAGTVSQIGDVLVSGTFSTDSLGTYTRTGGALQVGTLTGRAVSLADFGTGSQVQRIGAFTVNDADDGFPGAAEFSNFALSDATGLTLAGPLASDYIRISATGSLIWSGNLTTFGLPRLQQSGAAPSDPGSYLQVVAGANGAGQIQQIGLTQVITQDGAESTLRLQTPAVGGTVTLNDLLAPDTDLLVFIGAGHASGSIDLGDLLVSGQQGGSSFIGTVRGLLGQAAARASTLAPVLSADYQVNGCPIASVNCILLPIETVPQQNPLHDLAIGQARDELDDTDVLLPNVAEQDY